MTPTRMRIAAGVTSGALLAMPALAVDDDMARTQLEQRLRLTAALISDGPTAQRIQASGNSRANSHLDEGRVHHALARDLLAKGDLAGARNAADEALKHLGQARRLVPDAPARQAAARQRYEQMISSLDRLVEAWRQRVGPTDAEDGDLSAAVDLMSTARGFAKEQRHEDAVFTLSTAEGHVLVGMNRLMGASTLDYTARAASPAEEYQLEMARLRSLADLVPLAVNDLKPKPEAVALIDRYTEASATLRGQAQQRFQAGDLPQALVHVRNALLFVQRALTTAGLVTPASTGGTP